MFYSYGFHTGPSTSRSFEPRFTFGTGRSQISGETEHWVGMSFNSKYDGDGMKVHGRPHLNLAVGETCFILSSVDALGLDIDPDD